MAAFAGTATLTVLRVDAAACGGLTELIEDQRTGLLVPPGDADALVRAMARVAADPALARRLGSAARDEVARRFSLPRLVGEIAAYFRASAPARQAFHRTPFAKDSR